MLRWLNLSLLVIILDQLTKWAMANWLDLYQTYAVMPFFNLTLTHNHGAAFSFLAQAGGWQRWFFIGLALLVSAALIFWMKKLKSGANMEAAALAMILGGALGNVIDRIYHGYVIDFLDAYYGSYHWPAFNLADSAIFIGAVLLIVDSLRNKSEQ